MPSPTMFLTMLNISWTSLMPDHLVIKYVRLKTVTLKSRS